ncbi:MAG: hypothetical protein ABIH21_04600, partial [Patescibacteria group bacterium]
LAKEGIFGEDFAQDVCSLIHHDVNPSKSFLEIEKKAPTLHKILQGIISGEVDCDRMDYLLRDSYYCGVAYGQYDIDWMISSMSITQKSNSLVFSIKENGVRAFEDLLLARYHMLDQVYFHKTKVGFTHAVEQAFSQKEVEISIPTDPYEYAQLRDGKLIEMLFESAKKKENYWSRSLIYRIPPKRIMRFQDKNKDDLKDLQKLIQICKNNNIRYFSHSTSSELSHFGECDHEIQDIYVEKQIINGVRYIPMFEYSDLLQKYNETIKFTDLFVVREDYQKFLDITASYG